MTDITHGLKPISSSGRCTEPLRLKGTKLKQVGSEFMCQASDPGPQDDHPFEPPSGIRSKPDATAACHAYLYPEPRLDCSRRGSCPDPFFATLALLFWSLYFLVLSVKRVINGVNANPF